MHRVYLTCLVFSLLQLLSAALPAQTPVRSIVVTGQAEKELAPDRYTVAVSIQVEGKTTELARAEFRKRLEQVRSTFNDMDFPDLTLVPSGRTISDRCCGILVRVPLRSSTLGSIDWSVATRGCRDFV